MTLSIDNHHGDVSRRVTYLSARSPAKSESRVGKAKRKIHDPAHSAYSTYARATALRRDNLRHSADELWIHLAKAEEALFELGEATLSHDPAHFAYSTYAKATALRRDNLRRSADELTAHLAKAEKALREFGEAT
jgi:hypothetical protein